MTNQFEQPLRFAVYARTSTDTQDLSIESQEYACREAVEERSGIVVGVYTDSDKSGWSLDRPGFNHLRDDAESGKFDAIMFWRFDRLGRGANQVMMIKMLLRYEYNLKLYCVADVSQDDDDSLQAAIMEQMVSIFSAFYSHMVSRDTQRGRRFRAIQGEFNGSKPPLGYSLITINEAIPNRPAGLHIVPRIANVVNQAFKLYATGLYSDAQIASWMNKQPTIQEHRAAQKPIDKEMVRDLLQNRTYTGRVCHAHTLYAGELGEGKKSNRHRKEWFEGKHVGIVSDELFEQCQAARSYVATKKSKEDDKRIYLLHDRAYCARCVANKPSELDDPGYGKMRPHYHYHRHVTSYRCLSVDRGYQHCGQHYVNADKIDEQLIEILFNLTIPDEWQIQVEEAVQNKLKHEFNVRRMSAIHELIEGADFTWEDYLLDENEFATKYEKLQKEIIKSHSDNTLVEASHLLENFRTYWNACTDMKKPDEARKLLIQQLVNRVLIYDEQIVSIVLHGNFIVDVEKRNGTNQY